MYKLMLGLARVMAILGGIVLTALIIMTCLSVLGRSLNGFFHGAFMTTLAPGFSAWMIELGVGPVNGDFELVEAGIAFAIFAFLPLCQLTNGHASVDIFTNMLPRRVQAALNAVIAVVFAAVLILITWKLYDGMLAKMRFGETTFLLQFPIWWAYGVSLVGSVVTSVVAVYVATVRAAEAFTGQDLLPDGEGVEH